MIPIERLSVRQVAERLGWDRDRTLERLSRLHERHGGLLFRRSGPRTKFWVCAERLGVLWPDRFGTVPTAADLSHVHQRIEHATELAERALSDLGRLRHNLRRAGVRL